VSRLLLEPGADCVHNPLLVRELFGFQLGVDQVTVDGHFEAASAGREQLEVLDLLLVRVQQLARQTDGLRLVVSHRAVAQLQMHDNLLSQSLGRATFGHRYIIR
jgi:hypothetical protein